MFSNRRIARTHQQSTNFYHHQGLVLLEWEKGCSELLIIKSRHGLLIFNANREKQGVSFTVKKERICKYFHAPILLSFASVCEQTA